MKAVALSVRSVCIVCVILDFILVLMPVLLISSSDNKRGRPRWWLSPWNFTFDPSSSLLCLLSLPTASPLLHAAGCATGSRNCWCWQPVFVYLFRAIICCLTSSCFIKCSPSCPVLFSYLILILIRFVDPLHFTSRPLRSAVNCHCQQVVIFSSACYKASPE